MATIAAGYMRRSVADDNDPGEASREAQEAAIRRLAAAYAPDAELRLYTDWGISGAKDNRPDYVRLKADLKAGDLCCVFAYSMSRLGRSARELDAFFALAESKNVKVHTEAEGTLTATTAMGRFLRQIMASMAELEREVGRERSMAAEESQRAKAAAAGVPFLKGKPMYGYRHMVGPDGVLRREPNPDEPIEPLIAAYREKNSLRAAAERLNDQGIPSPRGRQWTAVTLGRVLSQHDPDILPLPTATNRNRPTKQDARFAGLLRCHCGGLMTANVARGQYYCGRGHGGAHDGRKTTTEKHLIAQLQPYADKYGPKAERTYEQANADEIAAMESRLDRLNTAWELGTMSEAKYRERSAPVKAKIEALAARGSKMKGFRLAKAPDLSGDDPAQINRELRALWNSVDLDEQMNVAAIDWAVPAYMYDEEAEAAYEADLRATHEREHEERVASDPEFAASERAKAERITAANRRQAEARDD